jgi:hypothetical protein
LFVALTRPRNRRRQQHGQEQEESSTHGNELSAVRLRSGVVQFAAV